MWHSTDTVYHEEMTASRRGLDGEIYTVLRNTLIVFRCVTALRSALTGANDRAAEEMNGHIVCNDAKSLIWFHQHSYFLSTSLLPLITCGTPCAISFWMQTVHAGPVSLCPHHWLIHTFTASQARVSPNTTALRLKSSIDITHDSSAQHCPLEDYNGERVLASNGRNGST